MQDEPGCYVNDKWEEDDSRGGQGTYQVEEDNRGHLQQFAQDSGAAQEETEVSPHSSMHTSRPLKARVIPNTFA